jgi:hypothetical protein
MRITIDTGYGIKSKPIIKIEGSYTIDELIKFLSKIYPDFTWKDLEITDELPKHNVGLWGQIQDGMNKNYNPLQNWPSNSPGTGIPYGGNPITYAGTTGTSHSAGSTLTSGVDTLRQYYDAMDLMNKTK